MKYSIKIFGIPKVYKDKLQKTADKVNENFTYWTGYKVGFTTEPVLLASYTIKGDDIPQEKLDEAKKGAEDIAKEVGVEDVRVEVKQVE